MRYGSGDHVVTPKVVPVARPVSLVVHLFRGVIFVKEQVVLVVPEQIEFDVRRKASLLHEIAWS